MLLYPVPPFVTCKIPFILYALVAPVFDVVVVDVVDVFDVVDDDALLPTMNISPFTVKFPYIDVFPITSREFDGLLLLIPKKLEVLL